MVVFLFLKAFFFFSFFVGGGGGGGWNGNDRGCVFSGLVNEFLRLMPCELCRDE